MRSRRSSIGALAICALLLTACGGGGGSDAKDDSNDLIVVQFALVDQHGMPTGATDTSNAYRNNRLRFTFSEKVDPDTVSDRTIAIGIPSGTNLFLTALGRFLPDGNEAVFDPTVTVTGTPNPFGFEPDSTYSVLVKGVPDTKTIKTLSGDPVREEFTTSFRTTDLYLPDLDQPSAVEIEPDRLDTNTIGELMQMTPEERVEDNDETGRWEDLWISSRADVIVEFSEAMLPATFDPESSFRVINLDRNSRDVLGVYKFSDDAKTVTFRPTFGYGRGPYLIQVILTVDLTDLAGNPISNPQTWIFLTEYDPTAVNEGLIEEFFDDNLYEDTAFSPPGAEGMAVWNPAGDPGMLVSTFGTNTTTVPTPIGPFNSGNCIPMGSGGSWGDYFSQLWYSSSVMGTAGTISGWKYFLYSSSAGQTPSFTGMTIVIGHSKTPGCPFVASALRTASFAGTPVTCVSNASLTVPSVPVGTPISFPAFTKAFGYDGSSSLVVDLQKKTGAGTNTYWSINSNPNGARGYGNPSSMTTILAVTTNYLYQCVFDFRTEESMAQSLWYRTEAADPVYLETLVNPTEQPPGTETTVLYQGADDDGDGNPDPATETAWTTDITDLDDLQYVRFRAAFRANLGTGIGPKLEDITIPYIFF